MALDTELLSRMQFAFTLSFHIIFPTLTIGLASFIALMEGLWLRTRRPVYLQQAKFWIKPFAITFGMGVVSGVVLSYEFGTNFSRFSEVTGPVLAPLLAYEVLTAFFLEAGFLGIMLFGWNRVSEKVHFASTLIVAIGTLISTFWILAANSWMHTPAGHVFVDGRFEVADWMAVIFNPSFPYRLSHMVLAAFISGALVVAAVSAHYLLRGKHGTFARTSFSLALWMLLVAVPLQVFVGDLHGLNVREHQPIKVAAMEGLWETERGADLRLFAIPLQEEERNILEVTVPNLASLILTHSWDGEVVGLKSVARADRPNVAVVFFAFRIMLGLGFLMLALALVGVWLRWRGRLYDSRGFLQVMRLMAPTGVIAVLAGWYVAEVGRQPWLVYGLMRTSEGLSPLAPGSVFSTLVLFVVVYTLLLGVYLYFIRKLIRKGPPSVEGLRPGERKGFGYDLMNPPPTRRS